MGSATRLHCGLPSPELSEELAVASRAADMDPGFFCRTSGLSNSTTWEAERGGEGAGAQLSLVLRDLKASCGTGLGAILPVAPGVSPHLPVAHDEDAVTVEDGGDAVCDSQRCAAPDAFMGCALDQGVRLQVSGGWSLINKDDVMDTKRG